MTIMKLFVDDERLPPDDTWEVARNYPDAIEKLSKHQYDELSLDHDLASFDADGKEQTGYDIAVWLAENHHINRYFHVPSKIKVHSANPIGKARTEGVISRYLLGYISDSI
jgi:Cyclic-phosphate processing Receiver domain